MSSSGAKAALEGYRKQALYTLACILQPEGHDLVFHPEGTEDLAVYHGKRRLRVVQVKAYTDNLTVSSFSPEKPQSFFHRTAKLALEDGLHIEVVSFGPIGIEIQEAWAGNEKHRASVREKLRGHQFSDTQIDRLFHRLRWQKVDEEALHAKVFDFLRASAVGGDPACSFDLLVQWILSAAERKDTITIVDLITKINAIGRYIAQRSSHHQEWYQSIAPIEDLPPQANSFDQLADEFYKGISTRYAHILAGLDVPRQEKLFAIDDAFAKGTRTVLIHGASGQGKTTLALRYLHDYIPANWRFSIRSVEDKQQATRIANALAGHLRVVAAPMFIHIDVSPRDREWTELVKSLLDEPNIRILITIREEDLARNTTPDAELGFPKAIALDFDANEARSIHERLVSQGSVNAYLSFDDAWSRFGGDGPLLEFVYFLTQAETLKERLRNQVLHLREEVRAGLVSPQELDFLRICCIATAFEARIDVASLAAALQLRDPIRTLQLLEREYLLRPSDDRRYIEALHPIRSDILAHELTDPALAPWPESARLAINHMPESDLEAFLLYAFARRRSDIASLVAIVEQHRPQTWNGVAAIVRSVLWLGVLEYVDANMALITEAQTRFKHAWYLALSYDIGGIAPGGDEQFIESLEILNNSAAIEAIRALRSKQTDKRVVYDRLNKWAATTDFEPRSPENSADWGGFAEVHFWLSYLHIETSLLKSISAFNLSWPLEHLTLRALGEIILSLSYAPGSIYKGVVEPFQSQIREHFCRETKTVAVEETDEMIRAHYLVPMEFNQGGDKQEKGKESENKLESKTIQILQLLRMLIPGRKAYGVQGYGHNLRIAPLPYDPTAKGPVKIELLLPEWPVRLNAVFHNLGDWRFRPAAWPEYAEAVVVVREQIVTALRTLIKALTDYFAGYKPDILRRRLPQDLWERSDQAVRQHIRLPKTAVDEWGLVSESTGDLANGTTKTKNEQSLSLLLQTYRPFIKANDEYFSSLGNYFQQSADILDVNSALGRAHSQEGRDRIQEVAQSLGCKPGTARLSLLNLGEAWKALSAQQGQFRSLLSRFIEKERLQKLEEREHKFFPAAWALWYQFVNHPELQWDTADIRSLSAFECVQEILRQKILRGLQELTPLGWRGWIASKAPPWEGQPALWLVLDSDKPWTLFDAYQQLIQKLEMAFAPMDIGTLEHYVLDHRWPHILIIPSVNGHYWNNGVWHLHSNLFWGGEKVVTPERTWLFMPKEVAAETLRQLGIPTMPPSGLDTVTPLLQAASELLLLVDHLADLRKAPEATDEVGAAILQEYATARATEASGALSRVVSFMQELLDEIRSERFDSSPYRDEGYSLLVKIGECIFPDGKVEDKFSIDIESRDKWAEKLMEGLNLMMLLKMLFADEAMQLSGIEGIPNS